MYLAGSPAGEPLHAETGRSLGQHAVQVFFFLSGVMVAKSFATSNSVVDFTVARGLRIFPALVVCVLLTALVLGPMVSALPVATYFGSSEVLVYIAKTLSLSTGGAPLPGVFEQNPMADKVNTSLWTLKYEVICYVMLAIAGSVGLFSPRKRWLALPLLIGFVALISLGTPGELETFSFIDNVRYFSVFFAAGTLAFLLRDRIVLTGWLVVPMLALFWTTRRTGIADLASAISLGYVALWLATKSFGSLREFCNGTDLSYGVYIFAGPIQQLMISQAPDVSPMLHAAAALTIVVPLAVLSWVIIEHPALTQRRSLSAFLNGHFRRRFLTYI
jgi:peptidoglycan/LPS O-acetylase OafA/YrhL